MDSAVLLRVVGVFVLAGLVKGVTGMGLPTLAMGLLGLWMPPALAAALMLWPSLLTNLAQAWGPHGLLLLRRLWPLWLGLVLLTVFSPLAGLAGSGNSTRRVLAGVLVAYGLWGMWGARLPLPGRREAWLSALAGGLTGLLTASTGVFVMPMVPWLQALRLPRDMLVQALGIGFTLASLALWLRLGLDQGRLANGLWPLPVVGVALLAAWLGLWLGGRLRQRLAPARFQQALYAVFLLLGGLMGWQSR